ncbi:MAG: hypothetical protein EA344_10050, partial [Alkalicoccus sp.]
QAIFRDACGKRKREDPPGQKDGIAEGFLRGKRRKKSRRQPSKTTRSFNRAFLKGPEHVVCYLKLEEIWRDSRAIKVEPKIHSGRQKEGQN